MTSLFGMQISLSELNIREVRSGDQCLLGDAITEVKQRRARLLLGWVTAREY